MFGKHVKIYNRGIKNMCHKCFRNNIKKDCNAEKVSWKGYIKWLRNEFKDIPVEAFGTGTQVTLARNIQNISTNLNVKYQESTPS